MKKNLIAILSVALCFIMLIGLVPAFAEETAAEPVHLTFMYFASEDEAKQWSNTCAEFTKSTNGRIEVEFVPCAYDAYTEKLLSMFAANEAPDTFFTTNNQTKLLYEQGKLMNVKPLLEADGMDPYKMFHNFDQINKLFNLDGGIYAVTEQDNPIVLYFNADLLEKAGVENPYQQYLDGRWTWESFIDACNKVNALTNDTEKYFSYIMDWNYTSWVVSNGVKTYFDGETPVFSTDPAIKEAADFLHDEVEKGTFLYTGTTGKGIDGGQLFMSGQIGFYDAGRWMVPTFKNIDTFKWDVVPFPKGPSQTEYNSFTSGYTGFAISADTKHPEEALEWFEWFVSSEGNFVNYGNGGNCVPTAFGSEYMVLSDAEYYEHPNTFIELMDVSVWPDLQQAYEPKLNRFITNSWANIISGADASETILANMDSLIISGDYEYEE